jgi:hypothetical protein
MSGCDQFEGKSRIFCYVIVEIAMKNLNLCAGKSGVLLDVPAFREYPDTRRRVAPLIAAGLRVFSEGKKAGF